jgi:hypothetical protein
MVVLSLLTLFAIVGISFVLYADAEALSSRVGREAENLTRPDVDPQLALSLFLGQMIYDAPDDESGVYSSLHGHSLARLMYGYNPTSTNDLPYNGMGRLHSQSYYKSINVPTDPFTEDDFYYVNYKYFPNDGFIRYPERFGWKADLTQPAPAYVGGFNPPYTYPDVNNMFLGAVMADGTLLMPSYHRPWLFGDLSENNKHWYDAPGKYLTLRPRPVDQLTQADVTGAGLPWPLKLENLTQAQVTNQLIPLIQKQEAANQLFPYPVPFDTTGKGGDVKNLIGAPGGNDSFWIDFGAPVMTTPDGKKYKMLIAPLIIDLDGRINVNVHGNILGAQGTGAAAQLSNQGWGPWEVSLVPVLNVDNNEWKNLFNGNAATGNNRIQGRYGPNRKPQQLGSAAPGGLPPHSYARVDYNAQQEDAGNPNGNPTARIQLPGAPAGAGGPAYQGFNAFPSFPVGYSDGNAQERTAHPLLSDVFRRVTTNPANNDDRVFAPSELEALLRFGDTGVDARTSDLMRLLPLNLNNTTSAQTISDSGRRRRMVTTHSFDVDRPGWTPWVWDPKDNDKSYKMPAIPTVPPVGSDPSTWYPFGPAIPFPNLAGGPYPQNSEFQQNDWRGVYALPPAGPGGTFNTRNYTRFRQNLNGYQDLLKTTKAALLDRYPDPDPTTGRMDPTSAAFQTAQLHRQQLAQEYFDRLRQVTGAMEPADAYALTDPVAKPAAINALRWLAQLAVNIVDYIDEDDVMTPFNWYSAAGVNEWVFGTELPRVVLNEVYAEWQPAGANRNVNVWVELLNPLATDPNHPKSDHGAAKLEMPPLTGAPNSGYLIYQIELTRKNLSIRQPTNVLGSRDPDPAGMSQLFNTLTTFSPLPAAKPAAQPMPVPIPYNPQPAVDSRFILPVNGNYSGPDGNNPVAPTGGDRGFYLLGPGTFPADAGANPPAPKPTLIRPEMSYPAVTPPPAAGAPDLEPPPTILLRRLANPYLQPNPLPPDPAYNANLPVNPYVTIDYVEDVRLNDPTQGDARRSIGRNQPYAAANIVDSVSKVPLATSQWSLQSPNPVLVKQPQHTMFRHNANAATPIPNWPDPPKKPDGTPNYPAFDWMVYLDRQLISPLELLHVSAFKPHELTQQFKYVPVGGGVANAVTHGHYAHWFNEQTRLYRLFEFLATANRMISAATPDGRFPGKVNINTIWDPEIFRALCDAQPSNAFTANDVYLANDNPANPTSVYWRMMKLRTPGLEDGSGKGIQPTDRPFLSLATGPSPLNPNDPLTKLQARGIDDTFLRGLGAGEQVQRLFEVQNATTVPPVAHPYDRYELMRKIFNNTTTRSNVFAVWLTVGFFEVRDDTTQPVKLGAELGRSEGRAVRHRMFAIVDRSRMSDFATTALAGSSVVVPAGQQNVSQSLTLTRPAGAASALNGTHPYTGKPWQIVPGTLLELEPNTPQQEVIVVTDLDTTKADTIKATFTKNHTGAFAISHPGNPGPWPRYDPRNDNGVVLYYSLID